MTPSEGQVYVYGVVSAAERLRISAGGVGGDKARVRRVAAGGVTALVSDVTHGPLRAARDLRAHWAVLEEAVSYATVLPVRFGTVMDSESAVRERFLVPQCERLSALLEQLEGTVELSVKGFYDEERVLADVVRENRPISILCARVRGLPQQATYYERIRLGELVAAGLERKRASDAELVLERLGPVAVRATIEEPRTKDGAVNAVFLVERQRVDEFAAATRKLAEEVKEHMDLQCVGPLPLYTFAGEQAAMEAVAWD